ncbi:hypothetical protein NMG29_24900 [Streptomyces cocklensis]|uniref:Knr4/Smi1-like domain-containing protein n=1 Tax=Actinacidiphila cocklensis TaxID=887465 RepID=A0A9W4DXW3_9ACTN|nr:hypothetical protein [Actinacidiphila cocklensis]MDD1061416.1 hypothetical protein [Actinacidiphila cocklensis]CAG6397426.1 conserved hypothetical protein [Actinacidiphila cocklensis]
MTSEDELLRILEPPAEKWVPPNRDEIVRGYGTALPADYLWLMETYGPGEVSGYLGILPPVRPSEIGNIFGILQSAAEMQEGVEGIEPEYLVHGGLFMWGYNPDGDSAFWSTVGEPDGWHVVTCRRHHNFDEPAWTRYDCGIVEFLVRTFQGRLAQNPFSGNDLWGIESPSFRRH